MANIPIDLAWSVLLVGVVLIVITSVSIKN
jgi:hypothetical protein